MQISILVFTAVLLALMALGGWLKQRKQYAYLKALPPYSLRKSFLSTREFAYLNVLKQAVGEHAKIYPKVRLPQILNHPGHDPQFRAHWSRVQRRYVDFLVCDADLKPILAVKFDPTANRKRAQPKDDVLEDALGSAELPLLRVVPADSYDLDEVTYKIKFAMARHQPQDGEFGVRANGGAGDDAFLESENELTDTGLLKLKRWTSDLWMAARRSS